LKITGFKNFLSKNMKKAHHSFQIFFCLLIILLVTTTISAQDFECGDNITDSRDGKTYRTVLIGNQCWMAENLNYGEMVSDFQQQDNELPEKTCYENNEENCNIYGGLYIWNEAIDWQTASDQGICPTGWHRPAEGEFRMLVDFLGEDDAGRKLKATKNHEPAWDGNNESGFTAIPAGVGHEFNFGRLGHWSIFWTSTEKDEEYAWFAQLDNYWYPFPPKYKKLYIGNHFLKDNGFSVRCLKD
jgi:uncharacterized protein (TIGR02145 family)